MDKREQLYQVISSADDLLVQLLLDTAMEYKNKTPDAQALLLELLGKRRNAHLEGRSKSYSREEAFSIARKGRDNV